MSWQRLTSNAHMFTKREHTFGNIWKYFYVKITLANKFGKSCSPGKSLVNDLRRLLTICKKTCKLHYFRPTSNAHMFTVTETHVWRKIWDFYKLNNNVRASINSICRRSRLSNSISTESSCNRFGFCCVTQKVTQKCDAMAKNTISTLCRWQWVHLLPLLIKTIYNTGDTVSSIL